MVRETSGAASTVNEIIDMGIVALGVLGTALVGWLFIKNRQMFMIIACLAILIYALSMLFFVNGLLYRMQLSRDVMTYRIIKWATILVIALDLMLLVASVGSDWWSKKKTELSKGTRSSDWQPQQRSSQPQQQGTQQQGRPMRYDQYGNPAKKGQYMYDANNSFVRLQNQQPQQRQQPQQNQQPQQRQQPQQPPP